MRTLEIANAMKNANTLAARYHPAAHLYLDLAQTLIEGSDEAVDSARAAAIAWEIEVYRTTGAVSVPILVIETERGRAAVRACCGHPGRGHVESADLNPGTGEVAWPWPASWKLGDGGILSMTRSRPAPRAVDHIDLTHRARCHVVLREGEN